MIKVILFIYFNSNPSCLVATAKETISACKKGRQMRDFNVDFF